MFAERFKTEMLNLNKKENWKNLRMNKKFRVIRACMVRGKSVLSQRNLTLVKNLTGISFGLLFFDVLECQTHLGMTWPHRVSSVMVSNKCCFLETLTLFLASIPEVLINLVPLPYSASEWRQSYLLKPKFHHATTAETSVVIPYRLPVTMLNVLKRPKRIFII